MNRWIGVLVACAGCPSLTPCEEAARIDEPSLTIGLGEDRFEAPIAEGDLVSPSRGSQGGQHLWLALRTSGLAPGESRGLLFGDKDVPTFRAALVGADDGVVYVEQFWDFRAMEGAPADAEIALGEFYLSGLPGEALAQPLILEVDGEDVCGNEVSGEVVITLAAE